VSRTFDGQGGTPSVSFTAGNATFDQGPITIMALFQFAASAAGALTYIVTGQDSGGTDVWSLLAFDLSLFGNQDFTTGSGQLTTGAWYWGGYNHTAGGTPRWHVQNVTTAGAWSHTDASGTVADGTGPVTSIIAGNSTAAGSGGFRGDIAAIVVFGPSMTDGAVQSACTLLAADLASASPAWGTLWNQGSTGTAVADFTGGGGNQTAITGTSVSASEPPGWSYSLTSAAAPRPPVVATSAAVHRAATY
jgi:hypothetical protein